MVVQISNSKTPHTMYIFFTLFLLSHTCFLTPAIFANASCSSQHKNIFILAGQSNMSGRGGVFNDTWDGIILPQCRPNPAILRLNAKLEWVEAREPVHKDIDVAKTCGVGPTMAFANSLLATDRTIGVIGLVPCAIGGTNISEWARGTSLYNTTLLRARAAMESGEGKLQGVLWYQGESDTLTVEDAEFYPKRLKKLFLDLLCDLKSPMLPIIQVALASGPGPYFEEIREAQLGIKMKNVRTVDAKGLKLEPGDLHLTTPSQVVLGKMLADAYFQIQASFIKVKEETNKQGAAAAAAVKDSINPPARKMPLY